MRLRVEDSSGATGRPAGMNVYFIRGNRRGDPPNWGRQKTDSLCLFSHSRCLSSSYTLHPSCWMRQLSKEKHHFSLVLRGRWGLLLSAVTALDQEPATCGSGATCSTLAPFTVAHTNISNLPWHCFKKLWNQFCSLGAERKIWGKPILHAIPVCQLSC